MTDYLANIRKLNGTLTKVQEDSIHAILAACTKHGVTDRRQIAYILATCRHEANFKPVEEVGKGKGRKYGGKIDMDGKPYTTPDKLYYGRGMVQLTWRTNYAAFSKLLKIDLLNRPELALNVDYAAEIIVVGMQKGMFTGKTLHDYFNDKVTQPINARRIVNGNDKAVLIAGYYEVIVK